MSENISFPTSLVQQVLVTATASPVLQGPPAQGAASSPPAPSSYLLILLTYNEEQVARSPSGDNRLILSISNRRIEQCWK